MANELLSYFFREAKNLNVVPPALSERPFRDGSTWRAPRIRGRILACSDAATLDQWLATAVTATSAEEVIATPGDHT